MKRASQRLGVFISPHQSAWVSCNSIGPNLIKSYQMLAKDPSLSLEFFPICKHEEELDQRVGTGYYVDLAEKIIRSRVTDLVFLDHQINPLPILVALFACAGLQFKKFRFCFHIYGDFTLFPKRWFDIGQALHGAKAKFICASDRQKGLVSYFERAGQSATSVCPFPVNTQLFRFSEKSRSQVRKKLGLSERQTLLLYTGRLSLQKGIVRLIEEFERLYRQDPQLSLALAGPYDNLGGLTSGISAPHSFYFHQLQEKLDSLPKKVRSRIFLLGELPHEELATIYSAADLFVSLSLHHDEDFGMCPAEAFSSGLPAVLNDWGGYASFKTEGVPCELVPIHLGKRGLEMDSMVLEHLLDEGLKRRNTTEERLRIGEAFAAKFGIAAVARKLQSELSPANYHVVKGFDWSLEVFGQKGVLTGEFYDDVYGRYVESPSN